MEQNKILKTLLPHAICIAVMVILPLIYSAPTLSGKVLFQNDIFQGHGGSSELLDYRAETGEEALWTGTMFSGMPTFQMAIRHSVNIGYHINKVFRRLMKGPISIVFICMLSAYIFFVSLGITPYLSLICAIGFGFSTFNIVSLEAGHNSKVNALAYFPGVMGGVIMAYRGKLWLGAALAAIFLNVHIVANHYQITYYLIMAIVIYGLLEFYRYFKEKELKKFLNISLLLVLAAILGASPNISKLWTTYDYAKETIRGGRSELTKPDADKKSSGLDKDYAMSWSYGKMESFTLIIPYFRGGASNESLDRKSNLAKAGLPANALKQVPTYWGDQPFTSGPVYLGAIYCFLFVLGMLLLRGPTRIWFASFSALALVLSWGKNFELVSDFLFYNLPLYNKFRTPSMILGVLQFTFPFAGALVLQKIIESEEPKSIMKGFLQALGITAGIILLFGLIFSGSYDFSGPMDPRLQQAGWPIQALQDDRASLLRSDSMRSLILVLLSGGLIYAFMIGKVKQNMMIIGLGVLMLGDLWLVDKRYLNKENFKSPANLENLKTPTRADLQIMEDDTEHFRVFNLTKSPFNDAITSYHHKSVGGYHAGKLFRYQELIERYLSQNNVNVLSMLNCKYFIVQDPNTKQPAVRVNPNAMGNAWIVDSIAWMQNADAEMAALGDLDIGNTVVIDERFKEYLKGTAISRQAGDRIELAEYGPNVMTYSADIKSDKAFAVFSEIWYEATDNDWKVYVDGEEQEHIRVNYLLRGMKLDKGQHEIVFEFKPRSWVIGTKLSLAGSFMLTLFFAGTVFMHFRASKKE